MRKDLQVILDSTYDGMIAVDKEGIITLFNTAAERLTGIDRKEAIGKKVAEVVVNTRLMYILNTGEYELNRKQDLGNNKIITNRMPVKDDQGVIIGAVAVFRDITDMINWKSEIVDLKEMQSMLEAILYATQDAISVVDQNGVNVMINPAYTRLTGLRERDIIGKPATADIVEGDSIHMKVLETKKPVKNRKLKVGINKKDVLATAAPIMVDGELRGSVGVLSDLSKLIKISEELKDAQRIIRKLEARYTFDDIVGENLLMKDAIEKAQKASELPVTVILRGESGTGKEIFAHAIHNSSDRRFNQFVRVNCAAITESILESELFGYVEGAFTGAKKGGRKGLFEQANGGTIFLDEIGDISASTQVKLLRVLQEKEVVRVGSVKPIPIDVRVITATNMNLEEAINDGTFREDLYYRLNVFPIHIPPLRARKDDLELLVENAIRKFNLEYGRSVNDISESALQVLERHSWNGNVRELENVIGRCIINMQYHETTIEIRHLPHLYAEIGGMEESEKLERLEERPTNLKLALEDAEKLYIQKVLRISKHNRKKAAEVLDISIRSLYYKMKKYNIQ
ncbi:MAG: sigma-54-dependent Fis family transcriptional regulator [Tissierellales bacterium]|nr:sigma-54-dependent Fis family transcriptional regulator [Tissierellales bacterium]